MNIQLNAFLNRIGDNFIQDWYNIRDIQTWMMEEIYRKRVQFPYFKKKTLFSWVSFNKNPKSKKNPSRFYNKKLDSLFRYFFLKMFSGLNEKQLILKGIEGHVRKESELFFEYEYMLSQDELSEFRNFKHKFNHPDHHYRIISYIFNLIIMVFGKLIKDLIKNDVQIHMLCAKIKEKESTGEKYLHFLIIVEKPDREFLNAYLHYLIFNFAEILPGIDRKLLKSLNRQKNHIYPIALKEYPKSLKKIPTVLYILQRKVHILKQIIPILDILNFVGSRVEDTKYHTTELVNDIIQEKICDDNENQKDLSKIFDFLNSTASLFSTFQSNNRANISRQYQLFFFYCQHFSLRGLKTIHENSHVFFPDKIAESLLKHKETLNQKGINFNTFSNFLRRGFSLPTDDALDIVFNKIFDKSINELNEAFFEVYLFSLNTKFDLLIEEIRQKNPNFNYSYEEIIHDIFIIIHNLISKIFIADKPEDVQQYFNDPLSRYTPKNIALRVLELRIFREIPLSDNNWVDYFTSRNKEQVKKTLKPYADIPDSYFFTPERLLKINMIYDRGNLESTNYLEEWIIEIIAKFYKFQINIDENLPNNYTNNELYESFFNEFSKGIMDTQIREKLEEITEFFVEIWENKE
ncbi:hypothetical protein DSAG12_03543 [Promethearchaeum syntrophicum]|uniref:Uncharacterized protein n=1 Tax=Promethearchaeum syntrophicum TaxID=2594042 RepID=A0A5B9DF77_9ARCH